VHPSLASVFETYPAGRFFYATKKTDRLYSQAAYRRGDFLVFGCETRGLPETLLDANAAATIRLPQNDKIRSQNLANAVSAILYEAIRQVSG
jgi:tRNA (cytidine/uridine-2'-O-)-methyltransferase